ncbi:hypothetical protein [Clostridium thailandense]|uniref:hypothetical protein n=1 Tax=Clostridium thailandense TaxID=2794346 RepID=UPI0039899E88
MLRKEEWTSCKGDALKKPEEIKGYVGLSEEHKKLFIAFLRNFYNTWDHPEEHIPTKVCLKKSKASGAYLKVDFKNEWLHVKGSNTWY